MRVIQLLALLLFVQEKLQAQELPAKIRDQMEQLAESTGRELLQDDDLPQRLAYYLKHPVDINTATVDELNDLGILSALQIQNLVAYRKLNGKLIDIYELQSIPFWDISVIQTILPYIKLGSAQTVQEQLLSRLKGQHSLIMESARTLEHSEGYDTTTRNHYLGDPMHIRLRYRYQYKDLLQFGVSGEKDPGEQFFRGAQKAGFDFYSFYVFVKKLGMVKALALGDYTVSLGQGLIQWQSLAFGRGADIISIKRQAPVLQPYRSSGEYNYNRGLGITLQKGGIEATVFGSLKKISGSINSDTTDWFSSLLTSGLHRSATEIADRNKITLFNSGGNLSYHGKLFSFGLNAVYHHFSRPFQKKTTPYNIYAFSGQNLFQSGFDYSFMFRNMHVFGETAVDMDFHQATVMGILIPADPKVDFTILYRNISKDYQSISGNAFTASSQPANENGIYSGVSIKPDALWQFNLSADLYRNPWIRYRTSSPSNSYDYLLQAIYRPGKQLEFSLRYRNLSRPQNVIDTQNIAYVLPIVKKNLRMAVSCRVNNNVSVMGRCEMLWLHQDQLKSGQGFLAYLDLNLRILKWMKVDFRIQQFETDDYESRIYAYGSESLTGFSTPAFYDKGFHKYIVLNCRPINRLNIKLLYSHIKYKDRTSIGTGLDTINGNTKSELGLQLQYTVKEQR